MRERGELPELMMIDENNKQQQATDLHSRETLCTAEKPSAAWIVTM